MARALALAVVGIALLAASAGAGTRAHRSAAFYLSTTQQGLADIQAHWWDAKDGWYYDTFNQQPPNMPLARLWDVYPLFETLVAVAEAQPTQANVSALTSFASNAAQLYWNPNLQPYGGYGWYPGQTDRLAEVYFDDSGWWGLSFIGTYKVTHDPQFLTDARRAFQFIVGSGWRKKGGGTWWETRHDHVTIEPLAAAVMIGTRLYEAQHRTSDLTSVLKLLRWANAHSFDKNVGLYTKNDKDGSIMDYVQGLMITANWELCQTLHQNAYCTKAQALADAAAAHFPQQLDWQPYYDVVYLRWMLEYGAESGDPRWYQLASDNAERALANARNESGYFLNDWDGNPVADGILQESSNLELFARLAATPPPAATAAGQPGA
ncbi:MAG: hypothetical protein JOZ56_04700 [Actinobacteria bacterium]|nr:hypothetical protein [Actinomycetota bacterium]